jgi:hypothetical protein
MLIDYSVHGTCPLTLFYGGICCFELWVLVERLVNDIKSKIVHGIGLRWPLRLCFCSCYFITIASRFAAKFALLVII